MKTDISRLTREQQEGANREFERLSGALRSFPPLVPKKPTKDSITTDKKAALLSPAEKWSFATIGQRQAWLAEARMPDSVVYSKWVNLPPSNRAKLASVIGGSIGDSITTDKRAALHRALDAVMDSRKGRAKDASGVTIKGITFTDAEVARYPRKVLEWSAKTGREPWSYNGDKPQYPASKQAKDAAEVITRNWEFANGKARPSGTGAWAFGPKANTPVSEVFWAPGNSSYGEAKRAAQAWAKEKGYHSIYLQS